MRGPWREDGQSATETMIMMGFLSLLIFGFIHMCMLATTKYLVNFAAFSVARAEMVGGSRQEAADGAMAYLRWWSSPWANRKTVQGPITRTVRGKSRTGFTVTYRVPFGLPIFNNIPAGGIALVGFSPYVRQPNIPEEGDNAE